MAGPAFLGVPAFARVVLLGDQAVGIVDDLDDPPAQRVQDVQQAVAEALGKANHSLTLIFPNCWYPGFFFPAFSGFSLSRFYSLLVLIFARVTNERQRDNLVRLLFIFFTGDGIICT